LTASLRKALPRQPTRVLTYFSVAAFVVPFFAVHDVLASLPAL
jgi:hypothetical protein